jgi:putative glutamine amidotransferase
LHQHLPDWLGEQAAQAHRGRRLHGVRVLADDSPALPGLGARDGLLVVSSHHQAVRQAGRLRVLATAEDGVIEAIDEPRRRFYAGVQWHAELGADQATEALGLGLIRRLIEACGGSRGNRLAMTFGED